MKRYVLWVVIFLTGVINHRVTAKNIEVESVFLSSPVLVDGVREQAWEYAQPAWVELKELPYKPDNGYEGIKKTKVEIKSLYDEEYVYFMFRWFDPTKSLSRFPWQKNKDGSWQHLAKKDHTKHENTYYEDKFAVLWNINQKGFKKKGCDKSCHLVENGLIDGVGDTSSGRHYNKNQGETNDEWQWKSARTNPVNYMDDGFVDNEHETNKKWGRHSDFPGGGGYYVNKDKKNSEAPLWMSASEITRLENWIYDDKKIPFKDNFKAGDRVPGIIVSPLKNARADVLAKGEWKDEHWQLEVKRKRITLHENSQLQDIQFNDLNKVYYFGVTAFDNSQINHIYHKKAIKLKFKAK